MTKTITKTTTTPALTLSTLPEGAGRDLPEGERTHRNLLKALDLVQALNAKEQELALVLLQSIAAWNGLAEEDHTPQ
jgi:hypothetical protein